MRATGTASPLIPYYTVIIRRVKGHHICDPFWENVPKRADKICSESPIKAKFYRYGASFEAVLAEVLTL